MIFWYMFQMFVLAGFFGYYAHKLAQGNAEWGTYGATAFLFGMIVFSAIRMADEDK